MSYYNYTNPGRKETEKGCKTPGPPSKMPTLLSQIPITNGSPKAMRAQKHLRGMSIARLAMGEVFTTSTSNSVISDIVATRNVRGTLKGSPMPIFCTYTLGLGERGTCGASQPGCCVLMVNFTVAVFYAQCQFDLFWLSGM